MINKLGKDLVKGDIISVPWKTYVVYEDRNLAEIIDIWPYKGVLEYLWHFEAQIAKLMADNECGSIEMMIEPYWLYNVFTPTEISE